MKIDPTQNTIVCGDNLEWLDAVPDESVDLCYIDPPYCTGQDKNIVWNNSAERRFFEDSFKGDVRYYMKWLKPRIEKIHRKLKPTGSIFLQCDWHASHHIRLALDKVFGEKNFRNEIIWVRSSSAGDRKTFGNKHDTIYFYTKSDTFFFNKLFEPYSDAYKKRYRNSDSKGCFTDVPLTAKGLAGGGYNYKWKNVEGLWKCPIDTMKALEAEGLIYYTKTGTPRKKQYLHEVAGKAIQDVWSDVSAVNSQSKESLKYPTQKPETLVQRIVECASKEGDVVLDCFGGSGTTAKIAMSLNRKVISGDVSPVAIRMQAERLERAGYLHGKSFIVKGLGMTKKHTLQPRTWKPSQRHCQGDDDAL